MTSIYDHRTKTGQQTYASSLYSIPTLDGPAKVPVRSDRRSLAQRLDAIFAGVVSRLSPKQSVRGATFAAVK